MNHATRPSSLLAAALAAALTLPGSAALAYDTAFGMPADWHDPMLAGNVYRSGLMVREQLTRAQQAVEAKHQRQAAKRLRFTLNYLSTVRKAVPYQAMMRDIKLARLAIHDHDPLLTAGYFRTLRADIDHIALAMLDEPETPAKALDLLERTEKAVHFTGEESNDWQHVSHYEKANWEAANAALKELQQYLDDHTVYVPLDYIANQIRAGLSALRGPEPDWSMVRAAVGEALTATIGSWVDDMMIQTRWGAGQESADKL